MQYSFPRRKNTNYPHSFRSSYKSKFFVLPIILFSVAYTIPKFFEFRLSTVPNPYSSTGLPTANKNDSTLTVTEDGDLDLDDDLDLTPSTMTILVVTPFRKSKLYIRIYLVWLNLFTQILLPFLVLVVMNYKIYNTIKKSEANLRNHLRVISTHHSAQNQNGEVKNHQTQREGDGERNQSPPSLGGRVTSE